MHIEASILDDLAQLLDRACEIIRIDVTSEPQDVIEASYGHMSIQTQSLGKRKHLLPDRGKHRKVTVSAVAKAAECNRDTFYYYYFASIDALAKCALDELTPASVPHIAVALAEGNALAIPEQAKARMRIIAKIARAHPRIRKHLEGALKNLWVTELRIDPEMMGAADESVLDFMTAGTVGFICEHLADADEDTAFDESFSVIARTFGKRALDYAKERGIMS